MLVSVLGMRAEVVAGGGGGFRETHALEGIVPVDRHPLHADRLLEYLGIG